MLKDKFNNNRLSAFIFRYRIFFSVSIIFLFALTVLRSAFYGLSSPDESFYLSIPYRLIQGDALLVDEWHASQFSAFLLYLPMKLFLMLTGGTDGIVLYFRCLFVFCQTALSLYTFFKLNKKYGAIPALISSVIFLLYVPETVNMLDYYTMSLMGFQVVTLILFCSDKLNAPRLIFSGIVFACVVISQPFNCLIYFLYIVATVISFIIKKKPDDFIGKFLNFRTWSFITFGILLVAAVFLAFLFSQITFEEFINNIGNLFGGHDHTLPFADTGKTDMFSYLTIINTILRIAPIGFYIILILFISVFLDKNRFSRRKLWILGLASASVFLITEIIISTSQNFVSLLFKPYIPFVFTYVCLMLTKKKDKRLFAIWWSGIVYIIFLGIISQALDYVGVIGFVISNTAFTPAVKQLYEELRPSESAENPKKSIHTPVMKILCCICALIISFDVFSGTAIKFIDDTMALGTEREALAADTVIESGPLKGVRTDNETKKKYSGILSDIRQIKDNSCESVLVAALMPWTYFCFDNPPATFTTWYIEEEFNLYEVYFKNPEKIPQCIYVPEINLYWGYDYTEISESHRKFFSQMFDVTSADGEAGCIMYVNNMKAVTPG